MLKDRLFRVIRNLQGGSFGMGRDLTAEEWREQAIEWAESDDNDELIKEMEQEDHSKVIEIIAEIWELEFAEVTNVLNIGTNNKRSTELALYDNKLNIRNLDSSGNEVLSYEIEEKDIISLLNWYRYQKRNGNNDLMF